MSAKTSIEWTDRTWNPTRGCTRVSEGCRNCYAERMASRGFSWSKGFATSTAAGPRWTGKVALIPEALDEPLRWRKPQRIFVNSMSDLFHESLPDEAIAEVFRTMGQANHHTYQILTKRPARMVEFFRWLDPKPAAMYPRLLRICAGQPWPLRNVWLGVSVEDQATADERIPLLLQTPAAIRFVSYEPALGPVDFEPYLWDLGGAGVVRPSLDWLIVGGESGPGARPFDLAWARSAVAQCKAAGVPVFVKQLGARPYRSPRYDGGTGYVLGLLDRKGGSMEEWPEDLRVREFPKEAA